MNHWIKKSKIDLSYYFYFKMDSKDFEDELFAEPTLDDADGDKELLGWLKKAREALRKYFHHTSLTDWTLEKDEDGVKYWSKPHEDSSMQYIKRQMQVKGSMMDCIKIIRSSEYELQTDGRLASIDIIKEYNAMSDIVKMIFKGNLVVSDRIFLMFRTLQQLPNGNYAICQVSVNPDIVEVDSSAVVQAIIFCLASIYFRHLYLCFWKLLIVNDLYFINLSI